MSSLRDEGSPGAGRTRRRESVRAPSGNDRPARPVRLWHDEGPSATIATCGRATIRGSARRKRRHDRRGLTQAIIVVLACTPFLVALLGLGVFTVGVRTAAAISAEAPKLEDQKKVVLAETSRIYAADGTLLAYLHGTENRTIIGGERIPQVVKDAVVAIEDERFYQHQGVDFQGILRALARDFEAGRVVEGASTITQQLVGNLYLDRRDTLAQQEVPGGGPRLAARDQDVQGRDPRPVPQHRLLRSERVRRAGGGAHLLRQGSQRPHPSRSRPSRRSASGAHRVLAPPAS